MSRLFVRSDGRTSNDQTTLSSDNNQMSKQEALDASEKPNKKNPFLNPGSSEFWFNTYSNAHYENVVYYDSQMKWTKKEKNRALLKLNVTVMVVISFMWFGFFVNKSNFADAVRARMPYDTNMNIYSYNQNRYHNGPENTIRPWTMGTTSWGPALTIVTDLSKIEWLERGMQILFAVPSVLVAKKIGPDIWLPVILALYCVLGCSCAAINETAVAMGLRAAMGAVGAGFIPSVVLYLSYFYTADQLAMRLAWLWLLRSFAEIFTGLLIYAFVRIEIEPGPWIMEGWRFMFLIEGLVTLVGTVICAFFLPLSLSQKKKWQRDVLTEREKGIQINSVLRDDPSKGTLGLHSWPSIGEILKSCFDFDLYPLYFISLVAFIPYSTYGTYLTLVLRQWTYYDSNLALYGFVIISKVILMIFITPVTKISERLNERSLVSLVFFAIWQIPLTAVMTFWYKSMVDKYGSYAVVILAIGAPNIIAILQAWVSRNSGSVGKRAISAAIFMMYMDAGYMISKIIYKTRQLPSLRGGSLYLFIIILILAVLLVLTKMYYIVRNKMKRAKWDKLNIEEQENYLPEYGCTGNKAPFFQFSH